MPIKSLFPAIALALGVGLVAPAVHAQGQSLAWKVAGNGQYMYSTVGNDYSNGTLYTNGQQGDAMVWSGPGSHWCNGDCSSIYLSGSEVGWQRNPHHLEATYAGGAFSAAPQLALDAEGTVVATSHLHLWAVLDNNAGNLALKPISQFSAFAQFDDGGTDQPPLYWRVDWRFSLVGNFSAETPPYWSAGLRVPGDGSWGTWGEFLAVQPNSSGSASGVLGEASFFSGQQLGALVGSLALMETGDFHGHGRADLFATISFSRAPISSPVPEPGSLALWTLGLLPLALARRRLAR